MCPEFQDQALKVLEPKDMYHCYPYHFSEIYKPPVYEPIGSYQTQHLNANANADVEGV